VKIAVWHNLPSGGAKRALHDLVTGLLERGHAIQAWCPPTADQGFLPLSEIVPEHVVPLGQPRRTTGGLTRSVLDRFVPSLGRLDALDEHARRCAAEIDRLGFDVLFAHPCRFTRVPSIGRYASLPKVLYLQEPNRWLYEARPSLPWVAGTTGRGSRFARAGLVRAALDIAVVQGLRRLAREESLSARAFDLLLVNSYFSRESVVRTYGLNARVAYLGVDTTSFRELGLPRQDFVVGVGSITRNKGLELAIECVAAIAEPRPPLVWAANACSDPDYLRDVRARALVRGVNLDIRMHLPDADLVSLLNQAALVLCVSDLEPFGLVALEAAACGTPVVGVAEGGLRETIVDHETGLLVDRDVGAIACAIQRLRSDQPLARRLGQTAAQQVRALWSLPRSVERIEARLVEAAGGR
jgi:glycosyltransferase involved in cell wall biosynthesis